MGTLNMAYDFFTSKEIKPEGYIKKAFENTGRRSFGQS